jgi:hypothetical protein
MATPKAGPPPAADGGCTDQIFSRTVGEAKLGFPVQSTTTTTTGTDADITTTSMAIEVDQLEVTDFDASLFEVPPGYSEAKSYNELLPSLASGGTLSDALLGSVADGTRQVLPKEVGKIRIGIVEPANSSGRQVSSRQVQQEMTGNFTKHPYEGVPLVGATPEALRQDAGAKECDYILTTRLAEAKTSKPGKLGGFLKAASGDGPPKDHHEVKMDYKLFAVDSPEKPRAAASAKVSSGGGFGFKSALKLAAFAGQMYHGLWHEPHDDGTVWRDGHDGRRGMPGMFNPSMGAMNMAFSTAGSMAMTGMGGGSRGAAE